MVTNLGVNLYRLARYKIWIRGGFYKVNGWDDFFRKRSEMYWSKRFYTNVRIIVKLTPDATDLHLDAVKVFTKKAVKKWDKRYEGIEWEPGFGQPKDFVSNGTAIFGDISRAEIRHLVKILIGGFLPLSKILGNKLSEVMIESNTKEDHIKTRKVSRNAYDRQSGYGQ